MIKNFQLGRYDESTQLSVRHTVVSESHSLLRFFVPFVKGEHSRTRMYIHLHTYVYACVRAPCNWAYLKRGVAAVDELCVCVMSISIRKRKTNTTRSLAAFTLSLATSMPAALLTAVMTQFFAVTPLLNACLLLLVFQRDCCLCFSMFASRSR